MNDMTFGVLTWIKWQRYSRLYQICRYGRRYV